jgi:hypothetical protein
MKIRNCIFCEDIRQEVDGKQSLMGVHGNTISVLLPPGKKENDKKVAIRLGIFITVVFEETDEDKNLHQIEFRLEHGETKLTMGRGAIPAQDIKPGEQMALSSLVNRFAVNFTEELKVTLELFNQNQELVESLSPEFTLRFQKKVITETGGTSKN